MVERTVKPNPEPEPNPEYNFGYQVDSGSGTESGEPGNRVGEPVTGYALVQDDGSIKYYSIVNGRLEEVPQE